MFTDEIKAFKIIANIPEKFIDKSFSNFKTNGKNETGYNGIKSFAENFDFNSKNNGQGLYIFGPPGSGKTHLVCGVVDFIINHFINVYYENLKQELKEDIESKNEQYNESVHEEAKEWISDNLIRWINERHSIFCFDRPRYESPYKYSIYFITLEDLIRSQKSLWGTGGKQHKVFNLIIESDLLILADIGSWITNISEWELRLFFELISSRYLGKKPIIIISHFDLGQLGEILSQKHPITDVVQILTRIKEMCKGIKVEKNQDHLVE